MLVLGGDLVLKDTDDKLLQKCRIKISVSFATLAGWKRYWIRCLFWYVWKVNWILDLFFVFLPIFVKEPGKLTCPFENQWLEDVFFLTWNSSLFFGGHVSFCWELLALRFLLRLDFQQPTVQPPGNWRLFWPWWCSRTAERLVGDPCRKHRWSLGGVDVLFYVMIFSWKNWKKSMEHT